jgi:hypothetical protein
VWHDRRNIGDRAARLPSVRRARGAWLPACVRRRRIRVVALIRNG